MRIHAPMNHSNSVTRICRNDVTEVKIQLKFVDDPSEMWGYTIKSTAGRINFIFT